MAGSGHLDLASGLAGGGPGLKSDLSHGGDRGQGLAPETKGHNLLQILGGGYLGSGMAFKTEDGVVRSHAAAVVNHLDEGPARVADNYSDLAGPGVHRVLHQFLHNGSRPLDDFSGGDHVRYVPRKYPQLHLTATGRICRNR